jgi:hypothetical protein
MNIFWQAIQKGDATTASDSFELPDKEEAFYRESYVRALIADAKFFHVAELHFGHEGAIRICHECHFRSGQAPGEFTPADFQTAPHDINVVFGNQNVGFIVRPMRRGPEGTWRIIVAGRRSGIQARVDHEQSDLRLMEDLTKAIIVGQYSNPDALIRASSQTLETVSTQPSFDRYTPEGAMNSFWQAIQKGDAATASNSIELPDDWHDSDRETLARAMITDSKLYLTMKSHFGQDTAVWICQEFGFPCAQLSRELMPADFHPSRQGVDLEYGGVNVVFGTPGLGYLAPSMHRGSNGIWRIMVSPHRAGPPYGFFSGYSSDEQKDIDLKEGFINAINVGQYSTPDILIQAIRSEEKLPGREQFTQPTAAEKKENLNAEKFDRSTVQGAIAAYFHAFTNRDTLGITAFFYSDSDSDGRLVSARAAKILSTLHLKDAIDQKFQEDDALVLAVGLSGIGDQPWWGSPEKEQRDRATLVFEDNSELPLRKVNGTWKLDITPTKQQTPAEMAKIMEHDSKLLDQIAADLAAGKYRTLSEVHDALLSAKLAGKSGGN